MMVGIITFITLPLALIITLAISPTLALSINAPIAKPNQPQQRFIITFKPQVKDSEQNNILSNHSAAKIKPLKRFNSQVVKLSSDQVLTLKNNPQVLRVEEDVLVYAACHRSWQKCPWLSPSPTPSPTPIPSPTPSPTPPPTPFPTPSPSPTPLPITSPTPTPTPTSIPTTQPIPWGVDRIDAEKVWSSSTADTVKVAIVDSGIDLDHPDLATNIKGGTNTINSSASPDDEYGHGTHVAGIVAAVNNSAGVVGVGHRIDLYAVKVLNAYGSGYLSDVIGGIDWSITNKMQIINLSLGTNADSQTLHDAVIAAKNAGITTVAAAGNSGPNWDSVIYPAKYSEVIAVAATNSNNSQPSWSSRGSQVDLVAPGETIYSTYKNGGYTNMSGTSMAAPHVSGAAALVLATHPSFNPSAIQNKLQATADYLAQLASIQQGAGLVDADEAALTP